MVRRILVLISGSGSNLQALIDAQKQGNLHGEIIHVISSNEKAFGLTRAEQASVPSQSHCLKDYYKGTTKEQTAERQARREQFNQDLARKIIDINPDLVVCAGWMLILSPGVLTPLEQAGITIINLHPALPGAFDGTHAIDRAWAAGQEGKISTGGVMIHRVIAEVDRGAPVLVKEIELAPYKTLEEYEAKVHEVEHVAIVEGTNKVLDEMERDIKE